MKKYSWKSMGFSASAQKVGEELEQIEKQDAISSKNVLTYARQNKDSELYKCFEWNDRIASEKYRLIQASTIISSISFVISEEPLEKQKIYYKIKTDEKEVGSFKNIKDILKNDTEYLAMCNKVEDDLKRCAEKYNKLIKRDDLKDIIFNIYKEI